MEEIGRVIESQEGNVLVHLEPSSSSCSDCTTCVPFGDSTQAHNKVFTLPNTINAKKDDLVIVSLTTSKAFFASFLLYLFPLIMMVFFYQLGLVFFPNSINSSGDNSAALVMASGSLFLSLGIIFTIDKFLKKRNKFNPELVDFYHKDYRTPNTHCQTDSSCQTNSSCQI